MGVVPSGNSRGRSLEKKVNPESKDFRHSRNNAQYTLIYLLKIYTDSCDEQVSEK